MSWKKGDSQIRNSQLIANILFFKTIFDIKVNILVTKTVF
jgi:hypothetical protein